jgi:hypothetical protein
MALWVTRRVSHKDELRDAGDDDEIGTRLFVVSHEWRSQRAPRAKGQTQHTLLAPYQRHENALASLRL